MNKEGIGNTLVNELIDEAVQGYKFTSYKYLDEVKTLVFTYLMNGFTYDEFSERLEDLDKQYNEKIVARTSKDMKRVKNKTKAKDLQAEGGNYEITEEELNKLKYKLDKTSPVKARKKFDKVVKRYYRTTNKTLQKTYIEKDAYLTQNVSKYDKVEKVVPYYSKATGEVIAYHDIADYNSMIYNVNLLNTAWNSTFDSCQELGEDIIYVEPHPYACPECQEYQGKFYSISGTSLIYPSLQSAVDGGLKHPNCKHVLTTYYGQKETDDYSGEYWEEMYKNKQKLNAVNIQINRLKTDLDIYSKLGNGEMVDKTKNKLEKLEEEQNELKNLTKIN